MKTFRLACPLLLAGLLAASSAGQQASGGTAPDPDIKAMVDAISADRIERSIYVLSSFKTRQTFSDPLPSGDGIGAAQAWIQAELGRIADDSGGRLRVGLDTFTPPGRPPSVQVSNIVATLPGSRPESAGRICVVTAHCDSRARDPLDADGAAPGADDDASGVAAVLDLAKVLSRHDFGATLVFLLSTGGEQGRLGAEHWAEEAERRGLKVEAVLDTDAIGNTRAPDGSADRDRVRLYAGAVPPANRNAAALRALLADGGENDLPAFQLARAVGEAAALYVPDLAVRVIDRAGSAPDGGEQKVFLENGEPAVRLAESARRPADFDAGADTPQSLDFNYIASVARLEAAALSVLARAPAPPEGVKLALSSSGRGSALSWTPSAEPEVAGYRIVWRSAASPSWEHALAVPAKADRIELPAVDPDDDDCGVEALDAAGHASPAAAPAR